MFRFIRWLFLMAIIGLLAGFLLTYPMRGQTSAERVCRLAKSTPCVQLATGWGEKARELEARLKLLLDRPAPGAAPHPIEHPARPKVTEAIAAHDAPPLDRHTRQERQELDKILAQRGSR
jgi:hypothetical protein